MGPHLKSGSRLPVNPNLYEQLIQANRALLTLETIDLKERSTTTSLALQECLTAYTDLLHLQETLPLSADDCAHMQQIVDRLRAQLLFFGEDV